VHGDRLDETDQQVQMSERLSARLHSIDDRLDASRADLDHVRQQIVAQIEGDRRGLGWIVLLGLLGTTLSAVCLGAAFLVL
jgi:hypothetical protein